VDEPLATPGQPDAPPVRAAEVRHVPSGGISVYANPDASTAALAELPVGAEVRVVGRRPPWVHIQGDDGLDGWVDGIALAGVAVGAAPVVPAHIPDPHVAADQALLHPKVVDKQGSSLRLGTGPVVGAIGGIVAIVGTALPWVQTVGLLSSVDAFGLSVKVLNGWGDATRSGFELGTLLVILAAVGIVVSLISGGGIVRRLLGFAICVICVVYVLQTQDLLTTSDRGIGTGLNVWDIVSYGVVVSFGGGLVMLCAPSR
jgi:hypothetical protein